VQEVSDIVPELVEDEVDVLLDSLYTLALAGPQDVHGVFEHALVHADCTVQHLHFRNGVFDLLQHQLQVLDEAEAAVLNALTEAVALELGKHHFLIQQA